MNLPDTDPRRLPQGHLGLLDTPTAQTLLTSTIPARLAYVALDGTPRIVPTWFEWTGRELVMATFVAAPHAVRPAHRIRDLKAQPHVAVSIDTETLPSIALTMRGEVDVRIVPGVVDEYAAAAHRYLGAAAQGYLAMLDNPVTTMARIALQPKWVGLIDFDARNPQALGGVSR